jgi:hypothetical protein
MIATIPGLLVLTLSNWHDVVNALLLLRVDDWMMESVYCLLFVTDPTCEASDLPTVERVAASLWWRWVQDWALSTRGSWCLRSG